MINYQLAVLIAVAAFTYSNILTKPDAMLNKLYNSLDMLFDNDKRRSNGKGYHPVFMILIHCEKCIAGQLALWIYAYNNVFGYILEPLETIGLHILFVAFTIFVAAVIRDLYYKYIHT